MKTKLIAVIHSIFVCTLLTNCTIEKRLFQPGYSIEWKKKIPKKDEAENSNRISEWEQETDPPSHAALENKLVPETEESYTERITEPEFRESILKPTPVKTHVILSTVKPENPKIISPPHQKTVNNSWEAEERKEFELFGVMSFGLYFSSLTLAILGIVLLTSPYFFVAAGFMILLALIFGIISVDKYRRDKSKYRRNFFGYFGMIASLATITFTIGLLLLALGLGSF